jgi:16S rRNA G966 N2-methylase RsmD
MSNGVMRVESNLPSKIEDLAQFVLVGRDKLAMVRAGIKALDKLDVAEGVRQQKKEEAQMLAEALLDAEVKIGEILARMPKASGGDRKSEVFKSNTTVTFDTSTQQPIETKQQAIAKLGFDKMQASRFETLAANKEIVEQIKQEARENDDLATRTAVLQVVKERQKEMHKVEKHEALVKIKEELTKNISKNIDQEIEKGWYKLGNQFLYFGSNLDKEFIDFLPHASFAFADPPYNANVDKWDSGFNWQLDYLEEKADIVAVTPGGWNACNFYKETNMNYIWEMFCWITNGMTHGRCGYANVIKTAIFGKVKPKISQDFWKINIDISATEDTKHKGRKPYDFMYHLIDIFSKEGDTIIDPFAGSGTTLLMCEKMNRVSYNAELDKQYCIDIIKRVGKYERI